MDFLYCNPNVLVIGDCYEIIVNVMEEGVCYVKVGKKIYHENESGIMPSVEKVHKFRLPQKQLDKYKKYTVYYKRVYDRKNNFPEVGRLKKAEFAFSPIEKRDDINFFYVADIHGDWQKAEYVSSHFGDALDLYIVNGDFGESDDVMNLKRLNKLIGDVTKGRIPAIIGRGNHDTRGKTAEKVTEYMACNNGKAYFTFSCGALWGVVLDCGEDKYDNHPEYRSLNFFEQYRKQEAAFLKKVKPTNADFKFMVCHVPFMHDSAMCDCFDIMPDTYRKWGKEIDRFGAEFMMCGHTHRTAYIAPNDAGNKFDHAYPVIVGVTKKQDYLSGAAVTLKKSGSVVRFVGSDGFVSKQYEIKKGFEVEDGRPV